MENKKKKWQSKWDLLLTTCEKKKLFFFCCFKQKPFQKWNKQFIIIKLRFEKKIKLSTFNMSPCVYVWSVRINFAHLILSYCNAIIFITINGWLCMSRLKIICIVSIESKSYDENEEYMKIMHQLNSYNISTLK